MKKFFKKYWWILIILLGIFITIQGALADQREAAHHLKYYFGELVIVHPDDIKIRGLRIEEIPLTNTYKLEGNVYYEDHNERFEVTMQKNEYSRRAIGGTWSLVACTTCPARKMPRGEEEFQLWREIYDSLYRDITTLY